MGLANIGGQPPVAIPPAARFNDGSAVPSAPGNPGQFKRADFLKLLVKKMAVARKRAGQRATTGPVTAPGNPSGSGLPASKQWGGMAAMYGGSAGTG